MSGAASQRRGKASGPSWRRSLVASLLAVLLGTFATARLLWPLPLHLGEHVVLGPFPGHVWAVWFMDAQLTGALPFSPWTTLLGFPHETYAATIAWGLALVALPLQPLLGPVGAYNAALLLTPGLSAAVVARLVSRLTGLGPLAAVGPGLAVALSPVMLGFLASDQVAKLLLWATVLPLLLLARGVGGPHRLMGLLLLPLGGMLASFSSPSLSLYLPFLAGLVVLHELWASRDRPWPALAGGIVGLGLLALSFLPARSYHGLGLERRYESAFLPASSIIRPKDPFAVPRLFASPEELFLGGIPLELGADATNHVAYVGLVGVVALGLALVLRRRGALLALGIATVGLSLSLGPQLTHAGAYLTFADGQRVGLPALLLERLGYPLATSGMYYRAAAVCSLGLALGVAALAAGRRPLLAGLMAWSLSGLMLAEGLYQTAPLFPRSSGPVRGAGLMAHVAELGGPVLDLPLDSGGDYRLLAAALHQQPTSALATNVFPDRHPRVKPLSEDLEAALAENDPAATDFLVERGFAWVVWRPAQERPDKTREWKAARLEALKTLLGAPSEEDGVYLWRVASARPDGD